LKNFIEIFYKAKNCLKAINKISFFIIKVLILENHKLNDNYARCVLKFVIYFNFELGLVKIFNKKCIIRQKELTFFFNSNIFIVRFILNLENLMCFKTLILEN
jgi:hypothetical protein